MDNPAPSLTGRKTKASPECDPTSGAPTRSACGLRTYGHSVVQGGSVAASPLRGVGLGLARNVDGCDPSHYNNVGRSVVNRTPHCGLDHEDGVTTSCRIGVAIPGARDVDECDSSHYTNVGLMIVNCPPHCKLDEDGVMQIWRSHF